MELLRNIYVCEWKNSYLDQAITKLCSGCMDNHPSVHQHDVCMWDKPLQVGYVIETALGLVDEDRVQFELEHHWGNTCMALEAELQSPIQYMLLHLECRKILNQNHQWKQSLISCLN